jgi:hypothetical protein
LAAVQEIENLDGDAHTVRPFAIMRRRQASFLRRNASRILRTDNLTCATVYLPGKTRKGHDSLGCPTSP